jgi:hypothetical protein
MSSAVGVQAEVLVLLVAPDQGVRRVTLQTLGERAHLGLRQPLGDKQVLAHGDLVAGFLEASSAWTEVGQCGLCRR